MGVIRGKNPSWRDAPRHGPVTWAIYVATQVLAHLAIPIALFVLIHRSILEPAHRKGILQRFGLGPVGNRGAIWIYAASLGETRAAAPLIQQIRASGYPVLLTHFSPAGLAEGWRLFPDDAGITHRYMPLDLFWAVRLFLWRAQPVMGATLEIEIYPAMLFEARRAGVPMVMVNGNLLERSMGNRRGLRLHLMKLYREFAHVFTRTADYRDRYIRVGVDPDRISLVGDLKSDLWVNAAHLDMGLSLRARWDVDRVLLIASSVRDEEPLLLPMVERLMAQDKRLGILWVPRSPQRFDALADALADIDGQVMRRSNLGPLMEGELTKGSRVIVGDSIGEMNAYYPMADLVFVGASLVPHGGHNMIEPMVHGKGVVMGPSIYGVAFAAEPARAAGALETLPNVEALGERIAALISDPAKCATMSQAALGCQAQFSGAAARTWTGMKHLLDDKGCVK